MDATTRSALVLAAAALLVVPLVNALVLEAQDTTDRQVRDPPEDPPDVQMQPDNRTNTSRELPDRAPASGGGNCTAVPEDAPAVRWRHPSPSDQPGAATQARAESPETQRFEVSELNPAVRVQLNVTDLSGSLTAEVYPDGAQDDAPFTVQIQNVLLEDVARGQTLTRADALSSGTWTATLEVDGATYDELSFTVVRAICQEAAP